MKACPIDQPLLTAPLVASGLESMEFEFLTEEQILRPQRLSNESFFQEFNRNKLGTRNIIAMNKLRQASTISAINAGVITSGSDIERVNKRNLTRQYSCLTVESL